MRHGEVALGPFADYGKGCNQNPSCVRGNLARVSLADYGLSALQSGQVLFQLRERIPEDLAIPFVAGMRQILLHAGPGQEQAFPFPLKLGIGARRCGLAAPGRVLLRRFDLRFDRLAFPTPGHGCIVSLAGNLDCGGEGHEAVHFSDSAALHRLRLRPISPLRRHFRQQGIWADHFVAPKCIRT